jgi:hypothetical protein
MAIAAAANPITILRITMLTPCQETHPSLYVANSAVRTELQVRHSRPGCSD